MKMPQFPISSRRSRKGPLDLGTSSNAMLEIPCATKVFHKTFQHCKLCINYNGASRSWFYLDELPPADSGKWLDIFQTWAAQIVQYLASHCDYIFTILNRYTPGVLTWHFGLAIELDLSRCLEASTWGQIRWNGDCNDCGPILANHYFHFQGYEFLSYMVRTLSMKLGQAFCSPPWRCHEQASYGVP